MPNSGIPTEPRAASDLQKWNGIHGACKSTKGHVQSTSHIVRGVLLWQGYYFSSQCTFNLCILWLEENPTLFLLQFEMHMGLLFCRGTIISVLICSVFGVFFSPVHFFLKLRYCMFFLILIAIKLNNSFWFLKIHIFLLLWLIDAMLVLSFLYLFWKDNTFQEKPWGGLCNI